MKASHDAPQPSASATSPRVVEWLTCLALGVVVSAGAAAQTATPACGNPFVNGYGPLDYRVDQGQKLKIVEDYHFTPAVEALVAGTSSSVGGDLDYTLRAFPNHHRALFSMMNLGAKLKTPLPPGAQFSVECYFRRALQFRPDDTIARMIYATYLARNGRKNDAMPELEFTANSALDNGFTQYNVGLIYFDLGEHDKALLQAHRALALGFDRPGLKQQLQTAGKWIDPPSPSPPATAASTPAS